MQSALSRIWTRLAVSISYDDNHYTTRISFEILVSKLELKSRYYVHLRTNSLAKGMNLFISPAID